MGAKDTPRCVNIAEAAHFSPDMRVNEEVMATPTLVTRMNCYEPGQVTPMHLHPGEDEIIYVVEGNGHFAFQDRENLPFRAGDLVCLPGDQFHSIVAGPDGKIVHANPAAARLLQPVNTDRWTSAAWEGRAFAGPGPIAAICLGGAVAVGVFAYAALMKAMRTGDIATVTPFRYTRVPFGIGLGAAFFGERIDSLMVLGCAIIVAAGLLIASGGRRGPD